MDAREQHCRVEVEEAHCAATVHKARKQARDVGTKLVVSGMSDHLPVNYNRDGGPINRNLVGILSQGPAEVDESVSGRGATLSWSVDSAEWFGGVSIIDGDRFRSEIGGVACLIVCNGVQLESSVAIRQKISEHLITPARAVVEWHVGIERLNVRSRALDEDSIANED